MICIPIGIIYQYDIDIIIFNLRGIAIIMHTSIYISY